MSVMLRVLLIGMSVLSLFYVIWKIRHSKMQIEYALFWIILSLGIIMLAIFPEIIYWVTVKVGGVSPVNFVYLFIITILLLKTFMMTIEISQLETKVKDLVQQIALDEKEIIDERKKESQQKESSDGKCVNINL
ncbi:MAG: DUF2304 domain-containing protein [Clostridium sp.]|nr:DUF2304 domain-containing protein [Clostridium sp.]